MPSVLFITDNTTHSGGAPRYLGPYRLAHALEEAGYHTVVLDYMSRFDDFFELLEHILTEDFVAVGISTTFMTPLTHYKKIVPYQRRRARVDNWQDMGIVDPDPELEKLWFQRLNEIVKRKSPNAKIIVGGAKAWLFLHRSQAEIKDLDYVGLGAMDLVFPEIMKDITEHGQAITVERAGRRVLDVLSAYPQPKSCPRHSWMDHWYIYPGEALPIEIARGCAFNCKFCHYDKKENIRKPLDTLRAEFIENYEKHGTTFYHFADDCFNDNRAKVEEVCSIIKSLPFKIEWVSYARFDVAVKFPETARMMVEAGARGLYWGIESLDYEVARRAGKGTPPDKIKSFLKDFYRDFGDQCLLTASFISGLPGETRESWLREVDWICENPCLHFINIGSLSLTPYQADLDQKVTDYAEYSRNPQKYGFEEVSFNPLYWRHGTMDLPEAEELAQIFVNRWAEVRRGTTGLAMDIWIYPHLRSLGLNPETVREVYFSEDTIRQQELVQHLIKERMKRWRRYRASFDALAAKNSPLANYIPRSPEPRKA